MSVEVNWEDETKRDETRPDEIRRTEQDKDDEWCDQGDEEQDVAGCESGRVVGKCDQALS